MTIITNDMRGQITSAVLRHGFAEDLTKFLELERPLVVEAYERHYSAELRAAMEALVAIDPRALTTRADIKANVRGMSIHIASGSNRGRGSMQYLLPKFDGAEVIVLDHDRYGTPEIVCEEGDEFGDRIVAYAEERARLNGLIDTRRAEVQGVLKDIRTDRQLRERWPAVLPIASEFVKEIAKPQLPMVPVAELNEALGLPPMKEAA